MADAPALGEKLLALLDESARTTTYKPALLLALIDLVQEYVDDAQVPVHVLAERVIELHWAQTLIYPTTGAVLKQTQTHGRATIVAEVLALRKEHGTTSRSGRSAPTVPAAAVRLMRPCRRRTRLSNSCSSAAAIKLRNGSAFADMRD